MAIETAPPGMGVSAHPGARLLAFRKSRRLSVRKLALAAGVSSSFVSQFERGKCNASVAVMQRLCDALDIHVADLFSPDDVGTSPTRAERRVPLDTQEGITKYLLTPTAYSPLALYDAILDPAGSTGDPYAHVGMVETIHVLEHEVTVQLGEQVHILGEGDSVSFSSETPHRIFNHSSARSRIHWLCAPVLATHDPSNVADTPADTE